jgi:murein DD-endopeptidase MepM/ murein hydrolase activator NlpD
MRRALLVFSALALLYVPAGHAWSWPVGGPESLLRQFSYTPADPDDPGAHRGIDIGGRLGARVFVPASGIVRFAGTRPVAGKTVEIETYEGYTATVEHLGSIAVAAGAAVRENQVAGTVGFSGVRDHDVPYAFFSIRVTADPVWYVDPLEFLRAEWS